MPTHELSLFSYEILGLVGREGAGPHDLLRLAKESRFFNWAGESQYYTEPKRLADLGYLSARREPGKTRERTVYTLTDRGLAALQDYARTPVGFTPLKSDALLRLLVCDLVGEQITRESIGALRLDLADVQQRLVDAERRAAWLPHREKYLRLVIAFMRRFLDVHHQLIDDVERELAPKSAKRARVSD
jgi:DNA-binding PadR family transcriptional regulator